ncbi:TetR/AcrR family transcriptional regulator [Nakamurella lactea]|uniref:TetR/AcrR family transcriptional regulator n=1 Tax=Nakamurella lactea TaxID=459515 RepID=UPI0004163245|nr:TetR/AcrR family transcriptional regulator [Nakamurella lactea]
MSSGRPSSGHAPLTTPAPPVEQPPVDDQVVIPGYLAELWRGRDDDRPGPKRAVDLRRIAEVAIDIADRKGLAAVSMRSVASALGFTSMALYRYLDSKEQLIAAMVDVAYGPPPPVPPGGWRDRMTAWARAELAVMRDHPWVLDSPISEPPLTPNSLAWMESALGAMDDAPLTDRQKIGCLLTVTVYVHGQAQLVADVTARRAATAEHDSYQRRLAAVIDAEALPRVAAMLASGMLDEDTEDAAADSDPGGDFEFGLTAILDGAAAGGATAAGPATVRSHDGAVQRQEDRR